MIALNAILKRAFSEINQSSPRVNRSANWLPENRPVTILLKSTSSIQDIPY